MTQTMPRLAPLILLLAPTVGAGQQVDLDGSFGGGAKAWRASASSQWRLRVGGRLELGVGLRVTYYGGEPSSYRNQGAITTATPATVPVDPSVWGVNLMVSGQIDVAGPVFTGANIDVIGVAGGASSAGSNLTLKPARGSILLYGNNDRGSLNSEFFLGARLSPRFSLRAGMSHYVTGYQVSDATQRPRYLRFDTVPFLALRWIP